MIKSCLTFGRQIQVLSRTFLEFNKDAKNVFCIFLIFTVPFFFFFLQSSVHKNKYTETTPSTVHQ